MNEPDLDQLIAAFATAMKGESREPLRIAIEKNQAYKLPLAGLMIFCFGPLLDINDRNRERQKQIDGLAAEIKQLKIANAALHEKTAALEARPYAREYRGVWRADEKYLRGDFTTHSGGIWFAALDTTGKKPGESSNWILAVQRGRDGKDARS